jgi:hypothetical protein
MDYSEDDTREEAWDKYFAANPEVLACWGHQNGRWPHGHPNAPERTDLPNNVVAEDA